MPPKQEQAVVENIPDKNMKQILIALNFQTKIERSQKLSQILNKMKDQYNYLCPITRNDILESAIANKLYVDPLNLNEQQKKDPKLIADIPTEMNSSISNKALQLLMNFKAVNVNNNILVDQKKDEKKETKKDNKKGGKVEEDVKVQEPAIKKIQFEKNLDIAFVLVDYPTTEEEMNNILQLDQQLNLVFEIHENIIENQSDEYYKKLLEPHENFGEDLRHRMQKCIEENDLSYANNMNTKIEYSQEDKIFINKNVENLQKYVQKKNSAPQSSNLRNLVIQQIEFKVDPLNDEKNIEDLGTEILKNICLFSIQISEYKQWMSQVELVPFIKNTENKDSQTEDQKKTKKNMIVYNKKFNQVKDKNIGIEIYLECILDDLYAQTKQNYEFEEKQQFTQINDNEQCIINNLFERVQQETQHSSSSLDKMKLIDELPNANKHSQYKLLIDYHDSIELRSKNSQLQDLQYISQREKNIVNFVNLPGINRYGMPKEALIDQTKRDSIQSTIRSLLKERCDEFHRFSLIDAFENLFKQREHFKKWDFGDRIYQENLDRNSLVQALNKALLFDPQIESIYDEKDDQLLLVLHFRNPPGRIIRQQWTSEWKVLPDVQNWIQSFNGNSNFNRKTFFDIDNQLLGNIQFKTKYLFPNDNGVIVCNKFQVGLKQHYNYKVLRQSLQFGINQDTELGARLWANFTDLECRMFVQLEEINSKIESSTTLCLQDGLIVKLLSNGDILQQIETSQKIEFKRNFEEIISPYDYKVDNSEIEQYRLITGRGTIIKYQKDGSIQIYYADGTISQRQNGYWNTISRDGSSSSKNIKTGEVIVHEPLKMTQSFDSETKIQQKIREDKTIFIQFADGSELVLFRDGTKIQTIQLKQTQKTFFIIEHPQYVTTKIIYDQGRKRMGGYIGEGSAFASVGKDDLMERSFDGRMIEIYSNVGKIKGYLEKQEVLGYNEFAYNYVYKMDFNDGTMIKVQEDGEVVLIGGTDLEIMKQENVDIGHLQLFGVRHERLSAVYTGLLKLKTIQTTDDLANKFVLNCDGPVDANISVSFNIKDGNKRPQSPIIQDGEYVERENYFLPQPTKQIEPRLFVIKNDETGFELLNDNQLNNYFRMTKLNNNVRIESEIIGSQEHIQVISCLQGIENLKKSDQNPQPNLIQNKLPLNVTGLPQSMNKLNEPKLLSYVRRKLIKFEEFNEPKRIQFQKDSEQIKQYYQNQQQVRQKYDIIQLSHAQSDQEFILQMKIMELRQNRKSA